MDLPGKRGRDRSISGEQRSNETCPIPAVTYRNKLLRIVLAGVATREEGGGGGGGGGSIDRLEGEEDSARLILRVPFTF